MERESTGFPSEAACPQCTAELRIERDLLVGYTTEVCDRCGHRKRIVAVRAAGEQIVAVEAADKARRTHRRGELTAVILAALPTSSEHAAGARAISEKSGVDISSTTATLRSLRLRREILARPVPRIGRFGRRVVSLYWRAA